MKIVRVFFIVVLVFVILMPYTTAKPGDYEYKIVQYVALGDSIAGGYGLEDVQRESYVGRVAAALEDRYGAVRLKNFGENGLRSDELLDILEDEGNEQHDSYMEAIQKADLITLSIGSNDLLQYLSRDVDLQDFKKNGDRLFTEACQKFSQNIPGILDIISQNAPNAQLFVNNIYNPCNDISFGISEEMAKNLEQMAEQYIQKLNKGFETKRVQSVFNPKKKSKKSQKYALVDVKGAFENSDEKLINMMISWRSIDPHPNREGHRVIAELIIPQIDLDKEK